MSEQIETGGLPVAKRPLAVIEAELDLLKQDTRQKETALLCNYIEVGRRLEEAKAQLPHGQWGGWLKKMEISQSTANNFMRLFREYGSDQQSLFGAQAKSQTFGNLTYSKALSLLAITDEEEREKFALENDVEHMSVRELNEAVKAKNAALDEAAAAKQEANQLKEQLSTQSRVYADAKKAQEKAEDKARRLQDALSGANIATQAAENECKRLGRELEELRNRPAEVDSAAVEAARKAAIDEMTAKLDKSKKDLKAAREDRKRTEDDLLAAKKKLAELKSKEPAVRELTREEKDALTAEAVNKAKAEGAERTRALEKQLAKADPDTTTLMVLFKGWQETYTKMRETLRRIEAADSDKAQKLRGGIRKALEAALEQMQSGREG